MNKSKKETQQDIVEMLMRIRNYCMVASCENCMFNYGKEHRCTLLGMPTNWRLEQIECIKAGVKDE